MFIYYIFSMCGPVQRQTVISSFSARLQSRKLVNPSQTVKPYVDNMTVWVYIRKIEGTCSCSLCTKGLRLQCKFCQRREMVRPPFGLTSEENLEAKCDFATLCFEGFGCKLSVFTTLDAFASQRCHLFSYISPCYQNCSHQRNDRLLLFNCISKAFYFTQPHQRQRPS